MQVPVQLVVLMLQKHDACRGDADKVLQQCLCNFFFVSRREVKKKMPLQTQKAPEGKGKKVMT